MGFTRIRKKYPGSFRGRSLLGLPRAVSRTIKLLLKVGKGR